MGNPSFRFKQFEVFHDRCGMKVGTDGVLLGAWTHTEKVGRLLDVGTGSGLIALMLAQGCPAMVDAVELDEKAAAQASENVAASPWADRVHVYQSDYATYMNGYYDLVVSNPPFFRKSLKAPAKERNQARHTDTLSYEMLIRKTSQILSDNGRLSVIVPADAADDFEDICWQSRLYLSRRCHVLPLGELPPKRALLEFSRQRGLIERTSLILQTSDHKPTVEFLALTAGFYLDK